MTTYFSRLFDYDSTVNRRVLELLEDLSSAGESKSIFAHLLASKKIWMTRLRGEDSAGIDIWPELTLAECEALIDENRERYRTFLTAKTQEELARDVRYQNSRGTTFETPVRDVLSHVLVHGGHHRGQIAKQVRAAGGKPVNTDYITYVRNLE